MNRAKFIRDEFIGYDSPGMIKALLKCLSPEELVESLDLTFVQPPQARDGILALIETEAETRCGQNFQEFLQNLLEATETLPFPTKGSAAACASRLFRFMSQEQQDRILKMFLLSPYRSLRNRAYNLLEENWDDAFEDAVRNAWMEHSDANAAKVLIPFFPIHFLVENFEALQALTRKKRYFPILLQRVSEVLPDAFEQIEELNDFTRAYILAKAKRPLTEEQAWAMYERNKRHYKIGLLIWCFGEIRLLNVLVRIAQEGEIGGEEEELFDEDFEC